MEFTNKLKTLLYLIKLKLGKLSKNLHIFDVSLTKYFISPFTLIVKILIISMHEIEVGLWNRNFNNRNWLLYPNLLFAALMENIRKFKSFPNTFSDNFDYLFEMIVVKIAVFPLRYNLLPIPLWVSHWWYFPDIIIN